MSTIIGQFAELVRLFTDVAMHSPVSGFLVLISTILLAFTILFGAWLFLGAIVDYVVPDSIGRTPPQGN